MKKIGLFFGSFNPIHIGHLIIANKTLEAKSLDELWFVVSPQNPHKEVKNLTDVHCRIKMIEHCIFEMEKFKICDIELSLPTPSYTIDTLNALKEKYKEYEFFLICGFDVIKTIKTWKCYQDILDYTKIIAYNRVGYEDTKNEISDYSNVEVVKIPSTELSSTFLRNEIKQGRTVKFMIPDKVIEYIKKEKLYL